MNKKQIINSIEVELLDLANLYNEVTYSDLQGIAHAKAYKIFKMLEVLK